MELLLVRQFKYLVLKRIYKRIAKILFSNTLKSGKGNFFLLVKRNQGMLTITLAVYTASLLIGLVAGLAIADCIESNPYFN
ncbi:hypothetical protein VC279_11850 [Xanthomonas sp. WHRI 10064A]|uniref:hypothetical protein n=1 Tax=unclassified Xanthomonas TaxID=2643310 RepID=UPI002B236280|nr:MULTISPECIES: hypothetical protein [unclassified Xanthomonas]MEA9587657.1 hypothetical protein [Xanthomonas sp. WHRI 10064B]MEA9615379.1 hypothetical protein [Xanthomonas sp. WHRI 10064A]